MFDPFTMGASFVYGSADASENFDRSGWLADIAVAYNGFDVVTPELFFTYSTGEDDDLGDSERLPTIAGDYAPDKVFFNSGGLVIDGPQDMAAQGTNDENFANANANISKYGHTLTEEDSIWEFSLVNEYQIYDELTATLGLAYIAADYDEDTWGSAYDSADGARMSIGIEYKF
jgi:hypothetical protein